MNLTDEQWAVIQPLIPVQRRVDGRDRPVQGTSWSFGRYSLDSPNRRPLARPVGAIPSISNLPSNLSKMGPKWCFSHYFGNLGRRFRPTRRFGPVRVFHQRHLCAGEKRGSVLGKPSVAKGPRSWPLQTAVVYLSPFTWQALRHTKSPLLKTLWQIDSWRKSLSE